MIQVTLQGVFDQSAYLAGRSLLSCVHCLSYLAGLYYQGRYGLINLLPT